MATQMTDTMQAQYEAALERAKADNVFVTSKRTIDWGFGRGETYFQVYSGASKKLYQVHVVERHSLVCDCEAGKNGRYCKHRAAVRSELIAGTFDLSGATGGTK